MRSIGKVAGTASALALVALTLCAAALQDAPKKQRLLGDTELAGEWIYDDFAAGLAKAKESGKPLLVLLRCVP